MKKNIMNTKVFPSSGSDLNIILTNLRSRGTLLTERKGLRTLSALNPLIEGTAPSDN